MTEVGTILVILQFEMWPSALWSGFYALNYYNLYHMKDKVNNIDSTTDSCRIQLKFVKTPVFCLQRRIVSKSINGLVFRHSHDQCTSNRRNGIDTSVDNILSQILFSTSTANITHCNQTFEVRIRLLDYWLKNLQQSGAISRWRRKYRQTTLLRAGRSKALWRKE